MNDQTPLVYDRRLQALMFCFFGFATFLLLADLASVKLLSFFVFGQQLIIPAGTFAFALTFMFADVSIEIDGRRTAIVMALLGLFFRLITILYLLWAVGGADGVPWPFGIPEFWTEESQKSYAFVFEGSIPIYVAGFIAIIVGFLFDIYIYTFWRDQQRGKNTFWIRNIGATFLGQLINSLIFVTIAFGAVLTLEEIFWTIVGQMFVKTIMASVDPIFALMIRNWAEKRNTWWAVWQRNLRVDYENYVAPK
jgi:queuosine precursor transporter